MEKIYQRLVYYFQNDKSWKPEIDEYIQKLSQGKIRAFQTFFESPQDCLSGQFKVQVLEYKDLEIMYPHLLDTVLQLDPNQYLYIFHCNACVNEGQQALNAHTIIY